MSLMILMLLSFPVVHKHQNLGVHDNHYLTVSLSLIEILW